MKTFLNLVALFLVELSQVLLVATISSVARSGERAFASFVVCCLAIGVAVYAFLVVVAIAKNGERY